MAKQLLDRADIVTCNKQVRGEGMPKRKGFLRHRREGMKCIYRPTQSQESASRFALSHVMNTFFQGSAADTVAAVFDVSSSDPSDEELDRLEQVIERTRKEGR